MKLAIALLTVMVFCNFKIQAQEDRNDIFVCYFPGWSFYRPDAGKYEVENIDPFMCTHAIYAFAVLNEQTYELQVFDQHVDIELGYYHKFTSLKQQNPQLKTLLAIGGWEDSQSPKYSELVADSQKVANFIEKAIAMLKEYNFDGLDFDWEYPGANDKENFANFITTLSNAFKQEGLMITMPASGSIKTIDDGYDVAVLGRHLDLMYIMTYDFHGGTWEPNVIDHHAPLYRRSYQTDDLDADTAVTALLQRGFPARKLILGIPVYGRSWKLVDEGNTAPLAPGSGPGTPGSFTGEEGILAFYEICANTLNNGWTVVQDPDQNMGPYAYGAGEWVGYDDISMTVRKTRYAKQKGLAGVMVWEITLDDFNNVCGYGVNPVLSAIKTELSGVKWPKI